MEEQKDTTTKDNKTITPIWSGSSAESASRLVTAVYMVTSFLSDTEPLKGHLRSKALGILSETVSFIKDTRKSKACLALSVEEIMSLIETSSRAALISPMNRDVLMIEFGRFLDGIKQYINSKDQEVMHSVQGLFSKPLSIPKEEVIPQISQPASKGHIIKKPIQKNVLYKKPTIKTSSTPKNTNGERKEHILRILKEKGETTIKDIATNIVGCSEKTIQRDLNEMVEKGIIQKKGERRWTTYFVS